MDVDCYCINHTITSKQKDNSVKKIQAYLVSLYFNIQRKGEDNEKKVC